MKHTEAKQLIRECLNEILPPRNNPPNELRPRGAIVVGRLTHNSVKVERWNIYEYDENTVMIQLYFKLLKQREIMNILGLINMYHCDMRMYSDKDLVCVDLKIDKRMI